MGVSTVRSITLLVKIYFRVENLDSLLNYLDLFALDTLHFIFAIAAVNVRWSTIIHRKLLRLQD
jgi:hypothetical protein